jgi:hypothetical protein
VRGVPRPSPRPGPAGAPTAPGAAVRRPRRARDEPALWLGLLAVTASVLAVAAVLAALACTAAGINWLVFDGLSWAPSA